MMETTPRGRETISAQATSCSWQSLRRPLPPSSRFCT